MAKLELKNISKRYHRNSWGLKPINLTAEDRQFVILLGPSGCGKSTTVRLVAGLLEPDSGQIFIGDREVTELPPAQRGVSMVFQNYAVWPHMSVFDNIAFALRLQKKEKESIKTTVEETAALVHISDLLQRSPAALSGGQRQRVALARALAVNPDVFLMDEPLSNLDAKLRLQMRTELKSIHQRTKATSLFVTHDQAEAMSLADKIIIMKDGEIVQEGTPDEVYHRSASTFVAGFLGSPPANFFDIELQCTNDKLAVRHQAFKFQLPHEHSPGLEKADLKNLTLAIRPEDLFICPDAEAVIQAEILVVEPQGSHSILTVDLSGIIAKVYASTRRKISPGETVPLGCHLDRLHFFHPETGLRIASVN